MLAKCDIWNIYNYEAVKFDPYAVRLSSYVATPKQSKKSGYQSGDDGDEQRRPNRYWKHNSWIRICVNPPCH